MQYHLVVLSDFLFRLWNCRFILMYLHDAYIDSLWGWVLSNRLILLCISIIGLVFITAPFVALIPAAIFIGLYLKTKRRLNLVVALLLLAYCCYESAMYLRIVCTGECNIRIDLLLIYPLILVTSVTAIVSSIRWFKNVKHH